MATATTAFANVDDVELIVVGTANPTIYFTMQGPPAVQQRVRAFSVNGRLTFYDPSQRAKRAFKEAIRQAMLQFGISTFPFFSDEKKVKVTAIFGVSNEAKDVDNMLKFLLDAIQDVVYTNDNMVYKLVGTKIPVPIHQQYTMFSLEVNVP